MTDPTWRGDSSVTLESAEIRRRGSVDPPDSSGCCTPGAACPAHSAASAAPSSNPALTTAGRGRAPQEQRMHDFDLPMACGVSHHVPHVHAACCGLGCSWRAIRGVRSGRRRRGAGLRDGPFRAARFSEIKQRNNDGAGCRLQPRVRVALPPETRPGWRPRCMHGIRGVVPGRATAPGGPLLRCSRVCRGQLLLCLHSNCSAGRGLCGCDCSEARRTDALMPGVGLTCMGSAGWAGALLEQQRRGLCMHACGCAVRCCAVCPQCRAGGGAAFCVFASKPCRKSGEFFASMRSWSLYSV